MYLTDTIRIRQTRNIAATTPQMPKMNLWKRSVTESASCSRMASDASSALVPRVRNNRPRAAPVVHVEENMVVDEDAFDPGLPVKAIETGKEE